MKPDVYLNARGETVMGYHVFSQLKPQAVEQTLKKTKNRKFKRRVERRIANGTLNQDGSHRNN